MGDLYFQRNDRDRVFQGDVLENFEHEVFKVTSEGRELITFTEPYIVVLSQDCDLQWDYDFRNRNPLSSHDKFLSDVAVAPAYLSEQFKIGKHLEELGLSMNGSYGKEAWNQIVLNKNDRFYFLKERPLQKMPALIIDFKRYYTVDRDSLYTAFGSKYLTSVDILFREDISRRFANYLSRIGLPDLLDTAPSEELVQSVE